MRPETYFSSVALDNGGELVVLVDPIPCIPSSAAGFFPDPSFLEFIVRACRARADDGQRIFRLWLAGCSSGQEAYSLAMALTDELEPSCSIHIFGTDCSTEAVATAREGVYQRSETWRVPRALRDRYLERVDDVGSTRWAVSEEIKRSVLFMKLNLAKTPYPFPGSFDVILCGDAMMFRDTPMRRRLVTDLGRMVKPSGFLLVGNADGLVRTSDGVESLAPWASAARR
jgi:chemotaxis protein methyltransferase CheR